jgi:hypothetical protein
VTKINLANPERYWLAVRADMPWIQDPDVEDQRQRWAGRDEPDWAAIAAAVQHVMDAVAGGRIEPVDEEDPEEGEHIVVDVDLDHLDAEGQEIVSEWFDSHTGPVADPWGDSLENGRHRLWNSWQAAPDAVLPIHSDLLFWLDSIPRMNDDFAASVYRGAMEGLELIPPTVLKRNPTFHTELRRVARLGGHDGVSPSVRWSEDGRNAVDALMEDPDLLPHFFAGVPIRRNDPVPPPGLLDVAPRDDVALPRAASAPWWRRVLTRLGGSHR